MVSTVTLAAALAACGLMSETACAFVVPLPRSSGSASTTTHHSMTMEDVVISPFDDSTGDSSRASSTTSTATTDGPLDLTWKNVELV